MMTSNLVKRYSQLSNKPIEEVEKLWRTCKKESSNQGRKNDWVNCVKLLQEKLNVPAEECILVYFDGAKAELLSETPSYALIKVHEIDKVSENLQPILKASNGVIAINFEHLFDDAESKHNIGYPYERMSEDVTSTCIGNHFMVNKNQSKIVSGVTVEVDGKKALVTVPGEDKSKIQYLDDDGKVIGEEDEVSNSSMTVVKSPYHEMFRDIWKNMSSSLSEDVRKKRFETIVKLEFGLSHLPESLIENLLDIAKENEIKKELEFEESDWNVIAGKDVDAVHIPLPHMPDLSDKSDNDNNLDTNTSPEVKGEETADSFLEKLKAGRSSRIDLGKAADKLKDVDNNLGKLESGDLVKQKRLNESASIWDNILDGRPTLEV